MTSTSAAKATGPVTEAGKAKMRDNALRHGLTSKHAVIKGEDPDEYAALLQDLVNDWKPADTQEEMLVTQIVESAWRLMRVRRVETRTYDQYMLVDEKLNAAGIKKCSLDPDDQLAACFHSNSKQFDNIRRYETTIERSYYRAITELRKIQKERKKSEVESVSQKPATPVPPVAIAAKNAPEPQAAESVSQSVYITTEAETQPGIAISAA